MSDAQDLIVYEIQDGVALITLNRPDKRNAAAQDAGAAYSTLLTWMSSEEKGTEEMDRIRKEHGIKAFLAARDEPFKS